MADKLKTLLDVTRNGPHICVILALFRLAAAEYSKKSRKKKSWRVSLEAERNDKKTGNMKSRRPSFARFHLFDAALYMGYRI